MADRKLSHFFNNVMIRLSYHGWHLKIDNSSEGYCWVKQKKITLGIKYKKPKELLLHEIAHINTSRFCNNRHNKSFWKRYEYLMYKFSTDKATVRYNEHIGFYKKCYDNKES